MKYKLKDQYKNNTTPGLILLLDWPLFESDDWLIFRSSMSLIQILLVVQFAFYAEYPITFVIVVMIYKAQVF